MGSLWFFFFFWAFPSGWQIQTWLFSFLSSFYSPRYLKDNFGQTSECIPRKAHFHLHTCTRGTLFQHGCYIHYVGSVTFIGKPSVWELETAFLLVCCVICFLGLVLAVVVHTKYWRSSVRFALWVLMGCLGKAAAVCSFLFYLFFFPKLLCCCLNVIVFTENYNGTTWLLLILFFCHRFIIYVV